MKKKVLSFSLSMILIISLFSITRVIALDDEAKVNSSVYESTPINNNYNKLHFYFGNDEYATINTLSELKAATSEFSTSLSSVNAKSSDLGINENDTVSITVEFESDFMNTDQYLAFLEERDTLDSVEEENDFRSRFNAYSKSYHREMIKKNIATLDVFDNVEISIIDYSPFVTLNTTINDVTIENLEALILKNNIEHISLSINETTINAATFNECLQATEAYNIISNETYTGNGIKIGVLEEGGVCDRYNENLCDKNITIRPIPSTINPNRLENDDGTSKHATAVTSILALMVPDAEFYVSLIGDYDGLNGDDVGIAWFIDQGCHIVNCSYNFPQLNYNVTNGTYEYVPTGYRQDHDAVFDYQIRNNFVTVVASAGNKSTNNRYPTYNPEAYISSPGYGYNVITVGGVDKNTEGKWESSVTASYKTLNNTPKPTVSAPDYIKVPNIPTDYNLPLTGTSFAAPQVAACIAMLMEKDSSYKCHPEKVQAAIAASAVKTDDFNATIGCFDEKVGAGMINLTKLLSCTTDIHTINTNTMGNTVAYSTEVFFDQWYKVDMALSWLAFVRRQSDDNYSLTNTNYDLIVYDPNGNEIYDSNGNEVGKSELTYSALEKVEFTAPISGDYRIVVYQKTFLMNANSGDHIAVSYYVDEGPLQ